jgi:chemotaxis protein methyltransferase CheR
MPPKDPSGSRALASRQASIASGASTPAPPPVTPESAVALHPSLEQIELELLLEGIFRRYGYDFRSYAASSVRRRVQKRIEGEGLKTISQLQDRLLHDPEVMERLLRDLSINVTAMFRDPTFFLAFRETVLPLLRTYPFIRIWHAGCSSGEEVYAMAILLKEEGLYDRARIYATDMNDDVLQRAKRGIYPLARMQEYTTNYLKAGGKRAFSEYYTAKYDAAIFDASLTQNVLFTQHNLAIDRSFSEFNAVICRNVMIYFDKSLRERALRLFHESLASFGVLALGRKETLRFTDHETLFDVIDERERIYRKAAA